MWFKNDSGASDTWEGQVVADQAYYEIQSSEEIKFASSSKLLTDIGSGDVVMAKDDSGNLDITVVNDAINYLKGSVDLPSDLDGVPLSRTKITKTGWHFQANTVEFVTSKLNSIYNADSEETDLGFTTIKFYNDSDVELVAGTQAELDTDCVKTVVDWEPPHDYEIIGGTLYQSVVPANNLRLWIVAIPDLTPAQGGSIPFADGGLNLKYMGTGAIMDLDGKTPKLMPYDATYQTKKFRLTLLHTPGSQDPLLIVFKIFKA